ncbi:transposase IS116/IS110/IS902 family protein [Burkholderia gladioli]|uniref:Transposase IS116/IS110/IS902 family protein n=1 Tax=Burkholderia gladioli TaxID=28095 RepID=A0AAW3EWB3_BURGA|nr:transposase IS116/IS110/IS902 family protein [Burkholderia gladioli]KGC11599.1 transposase IS116/IS110/IS902 family protein [Burkholderia gladioli]
MESCSDLHHFARRFLQFGHECEADRAAVCETVREGQQGTISSTRKRSASRRAMRFCGRKKRAATDYLGAASGAGYADLQRGLGSQPDSCISCRVRGAQSTGPAAIRKLPAALEANDLPPRFVALLEQLRDYVFHLNEQIVVMERELNGLMNEDDVAQRLLTVPGIGPITASVLASQAGDARQYRTSRDFAACLGSCHANTVPEARRHFSAFRSAATSTCEPYWSSARDRS